MPQATIEKVDVAEQVRSAVTLAQQGRLVEAESRLREAIAAEPKFPAAHHNLGVALAEQGKLQDAVISFRNALRLSPQYTDAHLNVANVLSSLGRKEEAVDHYKMGLSLRGDSPDALNGLGLTLTELGRAPEAVIYLQQSVRLRPDFAIAWNSLGVAFAEQGKFEPAEAAYNESLKINPRYVDAHANMANVFAHQGKFKESLASYDVALWLKPEQVSTRWNRSLAMLQLGMYETGFPEYEWRWKRKKSPMRPMPRPMWEGANIEGKSILLWAEQGLGDTIQFIRYAPLVKQRGARVFFQCPLSLMKLLGNTEGVEKVLPDGEVPTQFDFHVPLLSIPRILGTTVRTIPAKESYITADPDLAARWKQEFSDVRGLKVGIAWQGNPQHQWDRYRSAPLSLFEPLAHVEGVHLFSLQRGHGADQAKAANFPIKVLDAVASGNADDQAWAESAAIISNLDLVITVDTATAHLAAALGKKTWIALATLCDWRWLTDREDTPWYPSVRLFRQCALSRWGDVFDRIAGTLKEASLLKESR